MRLSLRPARAAPAATPRLEAKAAPPLAEFDRGCALFLDFDGTLVDLAPTPDTVVTPPWLAPLLRQMTQLLDGGLALVTGRPIDDIDRMLGFALPCVAGLHGGEVRWPDGEVRRSEAPPIDDAEALATAAASRFPGLLVERKRASLALHYRQVPALSGVSLAIMRAAAARTTGMSVLHGKMVVEVKPANVSKGAAVSALLESAPFLGRRPWFFGDDVTDESAFECVQSAGGVGVKVGVGRSAARHRLASPEAVGSWVREALAQLGPAAGERPSR